MAAWRKRTMVSAANISPVPLKKQSMAGKSILNNRGERSARAVEPTMEMVGDEDEKLTEVMMMWGMRWVWWSVAMAAEREEKEAILVSERSLLQSRFVMNAE